MIMAFQHTQMSQSVSLSSLTVDDAEVITVNINSESEDSDVDSNATTVVGELDEFDSMSNQIGSALRSDSGSNSKKIVPPPENKEREFDSVQEPVILNDDDKEAKVKPTRQMICHRCPTRKVGTFENPERFQIHIQRHQYGNHISCVSCHRPFIKLSYCLSHEIRLHDAQINYYDKAGVVAYAKKYVKEKAAKRAQRPAAKKPRAGTSATPDVETDEETDQEDPKFYNNHIVYSTSLYAYKGPPVEQLTESDINLSSNPTKRVQRSEPDSGSDDDEDYQSTRKLASQRNAKSTGIRF